MAIKVLSQTLTTDAEQDITIPVGSMMLQAAELAGQITVWYRCSDSAPLATRKIAVRGADEAVPAPDEANYVGTVILGGPTIWHVFERVIGRV